MVFIVRERTISNLAKLDSGLDESPTVMVGETNKKRKKLGENKGILKPSWAFVETNININDYLNSTILEQPLLSPPAQFIGG